MILPTPFSATSTLSPMLKSLSGVSCTKVEIPFDPFDFFDSRTAGFSPFASSSENSTLFKLPSSKDTEALFCIESTETTRPSLPA